MWCLNSEVGLELGRAGWIELEHKNEASSEESVTKSRPNPFTTGGLDHVLALSITTRFNNLKGNLDLDEDWYNFNQQFEEGLTRQVKTAIHVMCPGCQTTHMSTVIHANPTSLPFNFFHLHHWQLASNHPPRSYL